MSICGLSRDFYGFFCSRDCYWEAKFSDLTAGIEITSYEQKNIDRHNNPYRFRAEMVVSLMFTTIKKQTGLLTLLLMLFLFGCVSEDLSKTTIPTSTQSPTQILVTVPPISPTETPFPRSTSEERPILPEPLLEAMGASLLDEACKLPCYLGITPGKTTEAGAKAVLQKLGFDDSFRQWLENPVGKERRFIHEISLFSKDGMVEQISVSAAIDLSDPDYQKYWKRYTLLPVFESLGIPDRILLRAHPKAPGYGFVLIYEKQGIVLDLGAFRNQQKFICPGKEYGNAFGMALTNVNSGIDIFKPFALSPETSDIWKPVQTILGVGDKEFYDKLLIDPNACFEIKQ